MELTKAGATRVIADPNRHPERVRQGPRHGHTDEAGQVRTHDGITGARIDASRQPQPHAAYVAALHPAPLDDILHDPNDPVKHTLVPLAGNRVGAGPDDDLAILGAESGLDEGPPDVNADGHLWARHETQLPFRS